MNNAGVNKSKWQRFIDGFGAGLSYVWYTISDYWIRIEVFLDKLTSLLLTIGFFILFLFLVSILSFLAIETSQTPPAWATFFADPIIRLIADQDTNSIAHEDYSIIVSDLLAWLLSVVGLYFAVFAVLSHLKHRRELKNASVVEKKRIIRRGSDDLRHMYSYFRTGDEIIIFAGDFDWILKNKKLRERMKFLAMKDKLTLVSHDPPSAISNQWEKLASSGDSQVDIDEPWLNILNTFKSNFRFHNKKFKFSLIRTGQSQWSFLSLVPNCPSQGKDTNIGVSSFKGPDADALLYIVKNLCDIERCRQELDDWAKAEAKQDESN